MPPACSNRSFTVFLRRKNTPPSRWTGPEGLSILPSIPASPSVKTWRRCSTRPAGASEAFPCLKAALPPYRPIWPCGASRAHGTSRDVRADARQRTLSRRAAVPRSGIAQERTAVPQQRRLPAPSGPRRQGNAQLLKLAAPHDLWMHTGGGPGAHILIRRDHTAQEIPSRTISEARHPFRAQELAQGRNAGGRHRRARQVRPSHTRREAGTVRIDRMEPAIIVTPDPSLEEKLAL